MFDLEDFRADTRAWLEENCPASMREPAREDADRCWGGRNPQFKSEDQRLWMERMAERGWTAPEWPTEYGGGGLSPAQARVLYEEMAAIRARSPLMGMGLSMIGPTLLEFGTPEQKARHLPPIVRGEVQWCQGYSEPNAGSDLAALKTRADDKGDHFLLNGQKIWTSGAATADWMFALVRTDFDAPKHEGISFVLLTMDQPGVTVRPIRLISGNSPFCETFFDDAVAKKEDLVGQLNKGWTVGKRLLQHERSGIGGLSGGARRASPGEGLARAAKKYLGERDGRIADDDMRATILAYNMQRAAFALTAQRANEENRSGTPAEATSIFKLVGARLQQNGADLKRQVMGVRGLGVEGFEPDELEATSEWLSLKATTIYGGSDEIQANIIAKRVLGLPD